MRDRLLLVTVIGTLLLLGPVLARATAQSPLPPLPPLPAQDPGDEEPAPPARPPSGPAPREPGSVSLRVNPAHTGHLADERLAPPLRRRWSVPGYAPHLLAADGRVYVVGERVFALDQRTGKRLWTSALRDVGYAAYGTDTLFVSRSGEVHAIDPATGALRWTFRSADYAGAGAPVAADGSVYVLYNEPEEVVALRAADGALLWSHDALSGGFAPAVGGDHVYLAGVCGHALALRQGDGAPVWQEQGGCTGGGFETPVVSGGLFYHPSDELGPDGWVEAPIFDAGTGQTVGRHSGGQPILFDGMRIGTDGRLVARDVGTGRLIWARPALLTPIAIGHNLYGFGGTYDRDPAIVALEGETGARLWRLNMRPSEGARLALGAAPGLLIVAANGRIAAYESALRPRRRGIAVTAPNVDFLSGQRFTMIGLLGRALRGKSRRVRVLASRWRGGRFRGVGGVRASLDGGFALGTALFRNARFRVAKGGVRSRAITFYAYPHVRLRRARAAGRNLRLPVVVRARGVRFGHRRFVLYLQRAGSRRLRRVAGAPLRGRRGRAHTTLTFRPLRRVSRRDTLAYCIRGQVRLALGRPSPLTRRCGARRIRVA